MRRVGLSLIYGTGLLVFLSISVCQLRAQVLVSESDWKTLLKQISKDSRNIKTLKAQLRDVNDQGEQLAREEESSDPDSCGSSAARHSGCTTSNVDEESIEQKKRSLLQEWQVDEQQLRALEDQVNSQLARIRASKPLSAHEPWSQRVKKCATLPPIDAVSCLDAVKEDQP